MFRNLQIRSKLGAILVLRLAALADALQQERAISSGYVASRKSGSYHADMMNGRAAVDRGTASLRKTLVRLDLSDYSQLLQSLLAVIADIGAEPGGKDVKADIAVLVEISRAKEAASQSTSLLFAALINRKFGPGEYQRFATLVGEEASSS